MWNVDTGHKRCWRPAVVMWLYLGAVVVLDSAVQMVWKYTVLQVPDSASACETVVAAARHPSAVLLLVLLLVQFVCWMLLLSEADLSFVQPITAMSYVVVAIASAMMFDEHVGAIRIMGIGIIVAGIWLVGGTRYRTDTVVVSNGS